MMKYKVGDRVLIRQWDDMEKEFGLDGCGDIKCRFYFTEKMKMHCGRVLTVKQASGHYYLMKEDSNQWSWSDDMIERRVDMTKSELRSGMVVETSDGERMICVDKGGKLILMGLNGYTWLDEKNINDDMSYPAASGGGHAIMKVFAPQDTLNQCKNTDDIIWERQKVKEMTVDEIEKALVYPVKIVKEKESC